VGRLDRILGRSDPDLPEWEHVPEGWARQQRIKGWNVASVLEAYKSKLPAFREALEGSGPIAIPTSAAFPTTEQSVPQQNIILAYAYALVLASRRSDSVSILDWGGGLGLFYFLSKALLPPEVEIEYHCKELPLLCEHGREALPEAHFHEDESCLERRYDLVLASSSLQYSEHWAELLGRLAAAAERYLYLTRVPVVFASRAFVALQRAYAYGLGTEYLGWVFNRDELVDVARRSGMGLVREFLFGEKPAIHGAPEQDEVRGFLFRAASVPQA
jgi:putative methyltransferase (TIGR04325 family)